MESDNEDEIKDSSIPTKVKEIPIDFIDKQTFDEPLRRIDLLSKKVQAGLENGLFSTKMNRDKNRSEEIYEQIKYAKVSLAKGDINNSEYSISKGYSIFFKAVYDTSIMWRFSNVYAGHLWFYFIGFLIVTVTFYLYLPYLIHDKNMMLPFSTVVWGIMGGLLQDIWYLWSNVNNRTFKKAYTIKYISAPFLGGMLGGITYLVIIAGLIVLNENSLSNPREFIVMAIAAFAGYNWEWALKKFESVGEKF
jgi:hypothetical protein